MNLLIMLVLDLFVSTRTDRAVTQGSSTDLQIAGLAIFAIGGILFFLALVAMYLP